MRIFGILLLVVCLLLAAFALMMDSTAKAAATKLVIECFTYRTRVEYVELRNISGATIPSADLDDYKIGDEESKNEGEGMYYLPSIDLAANARLIIRVRNDGTWDYSVAAPTYSMESVSGYTRLNEYAAWDAGAANLADDGDHLVLLDSNDNVEDAVCWGTGIEDFVDYDGDDAYDAGTDVYVFAGDADHGCLSTSGIDYGFRRTSATDTDKKADWEENPTTITLLSLTAASPLPATLPVLGLVELGGLAAVSALGIGAGLVRRRMA